VKQVGYIFQKRLVESKNQGIYSSKKEIRTPKVFSDKIANDYGRLI